LTIEDVSTGPAGQQKIIVSGVTFSINAGSAVGIIGPSGSGKSSLARAIAGVWPIYRGSARLDGAALDQWDDDARGQHIGYLPQDIELFAGTVAQNISRFRPDATAETIVEAAQAAGVHDLILRLPNGYESEIGGSGSMLSAGQRQRVALARALYGNPFLVIMDEPNSNLDSEGEGALTAAILKIRERNGIAIVIAHRPSALTAVDLVLMVSEGRMAAYGPKDEVLSKIMRRDASSNDPRLSPLKLVAETQEQAS
jgi:ATP-binding cassette subfamily C protein PrsD